VIIDGSIDGEKISKHFPEMARAKGPDGLLSLEAIAEFHWYSQHRSAWSQEADLRPYAESF
jgi:hypothetical protein